MTSLLEIMPELGIDVEVSYYDTFKLSELLDSAHLLEAKIADPSAYISDVSVYAIWCGVLGGLSILMLCMMFWDRMKGQRLGHRLAVCAAIVFLVVFIDLSMVMAIADIVEASHVNGWTNELTVVEGQIDAILSRYGVVA